MSPGLTNADLRTVRQFVDGPRRGPRRPAAAAAAGDRTGESDEATVAPSRKGPRRPRSK